MTENPNYRALSEEEDKAYRKTIEMIRLNIANGVKFDLACEFVSVDNEELRQVIVSDALKIEIAELHYGKRFPMEEVSRKLGVSMERLLQANTEMIEDVVNTAGKASAGGSGSKEPTVH